MTIMSPEKTRVGVEHLDQANIVDCLECRFERWLQDRPVFVVRVDLKESEDVVFDTCAHSVLELGK